MAVVKEIPEKKSKRRNGVGPALWRGLRNGQLTDADPFDTKRPTSKAVTQRSRRPLRVAVELPYVGG
jgi:hypothetical protein